MLIFYFELFLYFIWQYVGLLDLKYFEGNCTNSYKSVYNSTFPQNLMKC